MKVVCDPGYLLLRERFPENTARMLKRTWPEIDGYTRVVEVSSDGAYLTARVGRRIEDANMVVPEEVEGMDGVHAAEYCEEQNLLVYAPERFVVEEIL